MYVYNIHHVKKTPKFRHWLTDVPRGTLKDFDASVMAPSPALVARNLSFLDENVQVPPGTA